MASISGGGGGFDFRRRRWLRFSGGGGSFDFIWRWRLRFQPEVVASISGGDGGFDFSRRWWLQFSAEELEKIDELQKSVNEIPSFIEGPIVSLGEDLSILTDVVDLKIDVINMKLSVLKKVVGGSMPDEKPSSSKLKTRERTVYMERWEIKVQEGQAARSGLKPKESQLEIGRSREGYFICGGDHRMRDCAKCNKLNALMAENDDSGKDVAPLRVNSLQLLSEIQGKSPSHKSLMNVKITVNGREHSSQTKVMNLEAKPIKGMPTIDLTDASDRAIGGVLVQCKYPIAFESDKLKDAKIRSGKHNNVGDALSQKTVEEYIATLTLIESDFLE
ncbi:hypothetical protein BUALT_Bualt17G0020500 [Buddleja alternifolia]|uniref:Uncharacterized protein n=1 Tax=Buddleja alternifolia TaxID=168488 RepID=A0AAV6W726_9LAMI|nr:hypothetical protein BUALT_Bualt17G0020500 [Buddleja alternifolia]